MTSKIKLNFLGTSAQIPTAERNHSAVLLTYNEENILVDCGEGTQRQFRKAKLNPGKITRILISHWHGDHVLGLPGILQTLALHGYNKTLYIYGPRYTKEFVRDLLKVFNFQKKYEIQVEEITKAGEFFKGKDFHLESFPLSHGIPCNGYSFVKEGQIRIDKKKLEKSKLPLGPLLSEIKKGKDISYNGKKFKAKDLTYVDNQIKVSFVLDTENLNGISKYVENANILVSEASFDESEKEKAKEHLHLTSKQAAEIAKKSKVEKLLLTHISQMYENNSDVLLKEAKKVFNNSKIVKDFDVVELK